MGPIGIILMPFIWWVGVGSDEVSIFRQDLQLWVLSADFDYVNFDLLMFVQLFSEQIGLLLLVEARLQSS